MNTETKNTYPDYKKIREEGRRIDCTITWADFSTHYHNSNRIAYTASDINRYLRYKNGGKF